MWKTYANAKVLYVALASIDDPTAERAPLALGAELAETENDTLAIRTSELKLYAATWDAELRFVVQSAWSLERRVGAGETRACIAETRACET